jgi:X-Pro dipeptidyl-peptidase
VPGRATVETLADDASKTIEQLSDAASSGNRLRYRTAVAQQPVRLSGTAKAELPLSFDRPAANVTAVLLDRAPDGSSHVISRGWTDPQNRENPAVTSPITPGQRYRIDVSLMPKDYIVAAGHRLEFVLASSDHDFTLRPRPGAGLALDLTGATVTLPIVGGKQAFYSAIPAR